MSRTGPEYVESEEELFADLDLKLRNSDISETTYESFIDLYEFANEFGDRVSIGGAKNANFQVKVDAHSGEYSNDTSVFTANVSGNLKIWPAKRPLKNNPDVDSLGWDMSDYKTFEREFQSLSGVDGSSKVDFEIFASRADLNKFKKIVEDFVSDCAQE